MGSLWTVENVESSTSYGCKETQGEEYKYSPEATTAAVVSAMTFAAVVVAVLGLWAIWLAELRFSSCGGSRGGCSGGSGGGGGGL